jgi:hypothetical protein
MKPIIQTFITVSASFLMGAGFWFLLFWFLLGDSHMMGWSIPVKSIYLLLSYITSGSILEHIIRNEED